MSKTHWQVCKETVTRQRTQNRGGVLQGDSYQTVIKYLRKDPSFSNFLTTRQAKALMRMYSTGLKKALDPINLDDLNNPLRPRLTEAERRRRARNLTDFTKSLIKTPDPLAMTDLQMYEAERRNIQVQREAMLTLRTMQDEAVDDIKRVGGQVDALQKEIEQSKHQGLVSRPFDDFDEMMSVLKEIYAVTSWEACGRRILKPSQALWDMLMNTDATVPASYICAPFQVLYVEFPYLISCVRDPGYPPVMLKGCYVSSCEENVETIMGDSETSEMLDDMGASVRYGLTSGGITIQTVGCGDEDGTGEDFVVTFRAIRWEPEDKDKTLEELAKRPEFHESEPEYTELRLTRDNPIDQILIACANMFLYMSMPDTDQKRVHGPLAVRRHKKTTKPKSKQKLTALIEEQQEPVTYVLGSKIQVLFDREQARDQRESESTGRETRPHWRRGHWRMQPHGPKHSLRKAKLIMPMLIRKDRLSDDAEHEVGTYEVGPKGY